MTAVARAPPAVRDKVRCGHCEESGEPVTRIRTQRAAGMDVRRRAQQAADFFTASQRSWLSLLPRRLYRVAPNRCVSSAS